MLQKRRNLKTTFPRTGKYRTLRSSRMATCGVPQHLPKTPGAQIQSRLCVRVCVCVFCVFSSHLFWRQSPRPRYKTCETCYTFRCTRCSTTLFSVYFLSAFHIFLKMKQVVTRRNLRQRRDSDSVLFAAIKIEKRSVWSYLTLYTPTLTL